ncbi:MAG: hypothetical protein ACR2PR_02465 [Pseudohongiellaceae bacterium]
MKLGFSEFSYGYAFTENLIREGKTGPVEAPHFPNLIEEGRLGYDVKVDLPCETLFFQFKLAELMARKTAKEIAEYNAPIRPPFFRMSLMPKSLSKQHSRLIKLEKMQKKKKKKELVYYAAPMFPSCAEFHEAYRNTEVHLKSALFSPRDIGRLPNDHKIHTVAYTALSKDAWLCSEPKKIRRISFEHQARMLNERLSAVPSEIQRRPSLVDSLPQTIESIKKVLPTRFGGLEEIIRSRVQAGFSDDEYMVKNEDMTKDERSSLTNLLVIRELARVGLGCEFLVAQPRQP